MTHKPQKPKKPSRWVLLWRGKLFSGKYGGLRLTLPLFPRHSNPDLRYVELYKEACNLEKNLETRKQTHHTGEIEILKIKLRQAN